MAAALTLADVALELAFECVVFDDALFDLVGERDHVGPERFDVLDGRGFGVV